jgi:hypothetical protein
MVLEEEKKSIEIKLNGSNVRYLVKPVLIEDALEQVTE